jgi:hypothetical protein
MVRVKVEGAWGAGVVEVPPWRNTSKKVESLIDWKGAITTYGRVTLRVFLLPETFENKRCKMGEDNVESNVMSCNGSEAHFASHRFIIEKWSENK